MESEDPLQQRRIACFWKRYIRELRLCQVPDTALPWYRKHVQAFINFAPQTRLAERRPEALQQWLVDSGRGPRLKDWQYRQRVDALRLLYCMLVKTEWAGKFDWEAWADPRRAPKGLNIAEFNKFHRHEITQRWTASSIPAAGPR